MELVREEEATAEPTPVAATGEPSAMFLAPAAHQAGCRCPQSLFGPTMLSYDANSFC